MELFADIKIFIYLAVSALVVAVLWFYGVKRKEYIVKKLFSADNYKTLIPQELARRRRLSDILFLSGILFLFIALAGPQWGRQKVNADISYSQTVLAVDVSASMAARDVKPNRLSGAKTMLSMLTADMTNQRMGIVAFTSRAFLQCPVTTDISALQSLLGALNFNSLPVQGTSLAAAVRLASQMLSPYPGKKALILVTDGEDHKPQDIENAVNEARSNDIKIIAVGIGSKDGELIPVNTPTGRSYKKDKEGKTVLTKLDEQSLMALASATGGVYIKYSTAQQTAEEITVQLASLDKSTAKSSSGVVYKNRYQIPLFIGILLVLSSILIPLRNVE